MKNEYLITFEEPIWWLLYVINILYSKEHKELKRKNQMVLDGKNYDWVEKIIFKKLNDYLKEIDLEILCDLKINPNKRNNSNVDYISLQFKKNNDRISSEQLSCGEWQYIITILFLIIRIEICFEIKKTKNYDPIVFIDQPEDNFDPQVQTKLIHVCFDICPKETQFFIAIHSPFVTRAIVNEDPHNCLLYDFNKYERIPIVTNKNDLIDYDKVINYFDSEKEIYVSLHEINYLVFSISTFDYYLELYYKILRKMQQTSQNAKSESETAIMKKLLEKINFKNTKDFCEKDIKESIAFRNKKCHIHFTKKVNRNSEELIKKHIKNLRKILLEWDKVIKN